jgi:hypothetical protein
LCTAEPQSVPLLARSPSTNRKYPPLPVDKLEEEINRRMADDNKLFREEFNVSSLLTLVLSAGRKADLRSGLLSYETENRFLKVSR